MKTDGRTKCVGVVMLTFEKIRELERVERQNKRLQKLPEDIIDQFRDYISRKERISSADIMEFENAKNTIRRFFEAREQKILSAVLDTVRTGLPPENMTNDEENVFYDLVNNVKGLRERFFQDLAAPKEKQTLYKVRKTLPDFVGPDMKIYQLKENELITLPKELEEFLLKEGVVEKIEKKVEN